MDSSSEAQRLVDAATARVLVTAADGYGRLRSYSERHSSKTIVAVPPGWKQSKDLMVMDQFPDLKVRRRRGRVFSKGRAKVLALPHEWGIELVVGIAAGVGSAAIIELSKWMWRKWEGQKRRGSNELSVIRFQAMEGKRIRTVELSGHVTESQVERVLREGFALMRGTAK